MALNIVIVDDSPVMRTFLRRVVQLTGLDIGECWEAAEGESALNVLRNRWTDLVLTDINMPRMDGEELVRQLKDDELLRGVPVIVVSTDATPARIRRMFDLGAKGYVAKPFSPEALRDEIEKVMEVHHV